MSRKRERKPSDEHARRQELGVRGCSVAGRSCRSRPMSASLVKALSSAMATRAASRGRRFKSCPRYKVKPQFRGAFTGNGGRASGVFVGCLSADGLQTQCPVADGGGHYWTAMGGKPLAQRPRGLVAGAALVRLPACGLTAQVRCPRLTSADRLADWIGTISRTASGHHRGVELHQGPGDELPRNRRRRVGAGCEQGLLHSGIGERGTAAGSFRDAPAARREWGGLTR